MKYQYLLFPLLFLALAACGGEVSPPETPLPAGAVQAASPVALPSPTALARASAPSPQTAVPATQTTPVVAPPVTAVPAPLATPTPKPEPTETPDDESLAPIGVLRTGANLRAGPGTNYEVIGEIKAGQEVFLKAQNPAGDWIQLDLDDEGQTWIAAFLLELPAGLTLPIAEDIPTPPPTPTPGDAVSIVQSSITIPTYPWQEFTTLAHDEAANWDFRRFDRDAYEASNPQPSQQTYRLVVLENQWLRLSLMPDLGGRLYQMIFKPTGSNELYQNPVIKPSPWGPGQQGNGWLAAGGVEWGLPVVEHGYAWGERWGFITQPDPPAGGVTVFDQAQEQIHLNVDVGLQPDSAAFTLDFTFENRGKKPVDAALWINAMLAPGPANTVGPELRFLIPGDAKAVHSTGEVDLPDNGGVFSWPEHNGRDVSRLGTWSRWLGFFASPQAQANWAGVYDAAADEGVVRIFPPQVAPGVKGFGMGWSHAIDPNAYTDDGSAYVELQGGLTPTFAGTRRMAPDERLTWREIWYPIASIGGVSRADKQGAAHLTLEQEGLRLRIFSNRSRAGKLSVNDANGALLTFETTLDPAHPADILLPPAQLPISFRFREAGGEVWTMQELAP